MIIEKILDSKQSKASKTNINKESFKAVSPGDLFCKKPVSRVEETKVDKKLHKIVSILYKKKIFSSSSINILQIMLGI